MRLTELEKQLLLVIINDYDQDGTEAEDVVDQEIWNITHEVIGHVAGFKNPKTVSGVMASIVKKGLAGAYEDGKDSTCWITQKGYEAVEGYI